MSITIQPLCRRQAALPMTLLRWAVAASVLQACAAQAESAAPAFSAASPAVAAALADYRACMSTIIKLSPISHTKSPQELVDDATAVCEPRLVNVLVAVQAANPAGPGALAFATGFAAGIRDATEVDLRAQILAERRTRRAPSEMR